jgi:transposase-like protein
MDLLTIGIISGVAAGFAVLAVAFALPRRSCPRCNAVLPRFRIPRSFGEATRGGWHCPSCHAKVSRTGGLLPD